MPEARGLKCPKLGDLLRTAPIEFQDKLSRNQHLARRRAYGHVGRQILVVGGKTSCRREVREAAATRKHAVLRRREIFMGGGKGLLKPGSLPL
jgi:hypothetical protein